MTTLADIGASLAAARRLAGLSQDELGRLVDAPQQQVSRWERAGYANVDLARVSAVAEALGVDVEQEAAFDGLVAAERAAPYAPSTPSAVTDLGDLTRRVRACGSELSGRFAISRIAVFGSFVYGTQSPESDVDLLVEMRVQDFDTWFGAIAYLERALGRSVDLGTVDGLHHLIRGRVLSEAVYVWHA